MSEKTKKYLRTIREVQGLSRNQAADQMGISYKTIEAWEMKGTTPTGEDMLNRVSKVYKVPVDEIKDHLSKCDTVSNFPPVQFPKDIQEAIDDFHLTHEEYEFLLELLQQKNKQPHLSTENLITWHTQRYESANSKFLRYATENKEIANLPLTPGMVNKYGLGRAQHLQKTVARKTRLLNTSDLILQINIYGEAGFDLSHNPRYANEMNIIQYLYFDVDHMAIPMYSVFREDVSAGSFNTSETAKMCLWLKEHGGRILAFEIIEDDKQGLFGPWMMTLPNSEELNASYETNFFSTTFFDKYYFEKPKDVYGFDPDRCADLYYYLNTTYYHFNTVRLIKGKSMTTMSSRSLHTVTPFYVELTDAGKQLLEWKGSDWQEDLLNRWRMSDASKKLSRQKAQAHAQREDCSIWKQSHYLDSLQSEKLGPSTVVSEVTEEKAQTVKNHHLPVFGATTAKKDKIYSCPSDKPVYAALIGTGYRKKEEEWFFTNIRQAIEQGDNALVVADKPEFASFLQQNISKDYDFQLETFDLANPTKSMSVDLLKEVVDPVTKRIGANRLNNFVDLFMHYTDILVNKEIAGRNTEKNLLTIAIASMAYQKEQFITNRFVQLYNSILGNSAGQKFIRQVTDSLYPFNQMEEVIISAAEYKNLDTTSLRKQITGIYDEAEQQYPLTIRNLYESIGKTDSDSISLVELPIYYPGHLALDFIDVDAIQEQDSDENIALQNLRLRLSVFADPMTRDMFSQNQEFHTLDKKRWVHCITLVYGMDNSKRQALAGLYTSLYLQHISQKYKDISPSKSYEEYVSVFIEDPTVFGTTIGLSQSSLEEYMKGLKGDMVSVWLAIPDYNAFTRIYGEYADGTILECDIRIALHNSRATTKDTEASLLRLSGVDDAEKILKRLRRGSDSVLIIPKHNNPLIGKYYRLKPEK